MRDVRTYVRTTNEQGKIGLLSLWMMDAEFRNKVHKMELQKGSIHNTPVEPSFNSKTEVFSFFDLPFTKREEVGRFIYGIQENQNQEIQRV